METITGTISFVVTYREVSLEVSTFRNEYRNLMALLYDKFYFDGFGDCKGIGRCGTCHIKIENGPADLLLRSGNEDTTLGKMENVSSNSRLSCQILITEALHQQRFTIMDDGDLGLY